MKFSTTLLSATAVLLSLSAAAQKTDAADLEFKVIKENPITSIKYQYRSGT